MHTITSSNSEHVSEETPKSPETLTKTNDHLKRLKTAGSRIVVPTATETQLVKGAETEEAADTETKDVVDPETEEAFEEMVSKPSVLNASSLTVQMPQASARGSNAGVALDPRSLIVDTVAAANLKKVPRALTLRKPRKTEWVRVHPDASYRVGPIAILEFEKAGKRESYIVAPNLREYLEDYVRLFQLFTAYSRSDGPFLWQVRVDPDGDNGSWNASSIEAAELAVTQWVQIKANMGEKLYEIRTATGDFKDPVWPTQSFEELLDGVRN